MAINSCYQDYLRFCERHGVTPDGYERWLKNNNWGDRHPCPCGPEACKEQPA